MIKQGEIEQKQLKDNVINNNSHIMRSFLWNFLFAIFMGWQALLVASGLWKGRFFTRPWARIYDLSFAHGISGWVAN